MLHTFISKQTALATFLMVPCWPTPNPLQSESNFSVQWSPIYERAFGMVSQASSVYPSDTSDT